MSALQGFTQVSSGRAGDEAIKVMECLWATS